MTVASRVGETGDARQLIVVTAASAITTVASLTLWTRHGACFARSDGPFVARIGVNGFSSHHHEGDGTTPIGDFGVGAVMYGNAPNPGVHYRYHRLSCGDWWDEDPSSPAYNSFQHVPCGIGPSFGGESEPLWEERVAYPSFAVIDYNVAPVRAGAGSGIFLHADIGTATTGCVSLALPELDAVLRKLRPADHPLVVLGPSADLAAL